jgi:hypothetical protein
MGLLFSRSTTRGRVRLGLAGVVVMAGPVLPGVADGATGPQGPAGAAGATGSAAVATLESEVSSLQAEVSSLQSTLAGVTRSGSTLLLSGMNVQIESGAGATDAPVNGLGNLILGYDADPGTQTGSHNLVLTMASHVPAVAVDR